MESKVEEVFECEDCLSLIRRRKGVEGERKYIMEGSLEIMLRRFPHFDIDKPENAYPERK